MVSTAIFAVIAIFFLTLPSSSTSPTEYVSASHRHQLPCFIKAPPVSLCSRKAACVVGATLRPTPVVLRGSSLTGARRHCWLPRLGVCTMVLKKGEGDSPRPSSYDWAALGTSSARSRMDVTVEKKGAPSSVEEPSEDGERVGVDVDEVEEEMGENRIEEIKEEIRDVDEVRAMLEGMDKDESVVRELKQLASLREELVRGLEAIEEEMLMRAKQDKPSIEMEMPDTGHAAPVNRDGATGPLRGQGFSKARDAGGSGLGRSPSAGERSKSAGANGRGGDLSRDDKGGDVSRDLIATLAQRGLMPDGVPPHRDSFFLALAKGLFRAGLRPQGYEFEEGDVMGSRKQYPGVAKRAKFELMRLLSSKAHKLNTIGGWRLSAAEFSRYFSKAWWSVPAARNDLFTAAAYHFSVSIECYTVSDGEVHVDTYTPPDGSPTMANIVMCRRDEHVISTVSISAPPSEGDEKDEGSGSDSSSSRVLKLKQEGRKKKRQRSSSRDSIPVVDVDTALGLFEDEYGEYEGLEYDVEDWDALMDDSESDYDDEVTFGEDPRRDRVVYEGRAQVATRRVFVVIMLDDAARDAVSGTANMLRDKFPLENRQLDRVLRWVDKDAMHITIKSVDVPEDGMDRVVDSLEKCIRGLGLGAFEIRTGDIGCFWAAAGTGWGRIPRVMWQGIHHSDVGPLLTLHDSLDLSFDTFGFPCANRPFCAHITIAKTVRREALNGNDRRTLRVFAKWIQDPSRPMELQRALAAGLAPPKREGSKRGYRRFKNWYGRYVEDVRTGKIKSARKINTRYLISEDEDFDQDESGVSIERSTVVFEKSDSARFDDEDAEEDNFYIDVLESDRQVSLRLGECARVLVKKICLVQAVPRTDGRKGIKYETLREIDLVEEEEQL